MRLLLLLGRAAVLLLLNWFVCRTPNGPRRDAETCQATQLADKNSAETQFGGDANGCKRRWSGETEANWEVTTQRYPTFPYHLT